ncbi:hypothetical protein BOTBODRAFT_31307 [Botryobasidium botryosum FD-172 SS1]|uniref:PHD-type domain-containing protein n=1 Tax=Botryobasidium botryosum (strain FD-172 SS1) TaxID=930990 RepID=A0A067MK03_BOTB1|nr:hypothetical protein BOTBODRAFT_31307 [Botryobasidium botryosum FD-172 SS1]
MPRTRACPVTTAAPPAPPPAPPAAPSAAPAVVLALRQDPAFAALSHFLFTFQAAIPGDPLAVSALEDDICYTTNTVIPRIVSRLLVVLTSDRRITAENFVPSFLKQYSRRCPDALNPLGTDEEPVEWAALESKQRLDMLLALCEWQFTGAQRLRSMMDDNFSHTWRLDPIGWDAKGNAYWYIGEDRLWVQHPLPAPPKPKLPKIKLKMKKTKAPSRVAKAKAPPAPIEPPTNGRRTRSKASSVASTPSTPTLQRRASKRSAAARDSTGIATPPNKRPRMSGARTSSRLRNLTDDGWQEIPAELLAEKDRASRSRKRKLHLGLDDSDDESELTELSDEVPAARAEAQENEDEQEREEEKDEEIRDEENDEEEEKPKEPTPPPEFPDFIEWETICVTHADWEAFPKQFASSKNPKEKALYAVVSGIAAAVCAKFEEQERQEAAAAAVQNRKRSSRLLVREAEQASIDAAKEQRRLEEERRKREAAVKREEETRLRKEREREERRLEREERMREREEKRLAALENATPAGSTPGGGEQGSKTEEEEVDVDDSKRGPSVAGSSSVHTAGTRGTPTGTDEPWELDCEICKRKGWNIDDGKEITCCETCSKWQHTDCHDHADERAGRSRRDWSKVEFTCKACSKKEKRSRPSRTSTSTPSTSRKRKAPGTAGKTAGGQVPLKMPPAALPPNAAPPRYVAHPGMGILPAGSLPKHPTSNMYYPNGLASTPRLPVLYPSVGNATSPNRTIHPHTPVNPYVNFPAYSAHLVPQPPPPPTQPMHQAYGRPNIAPQPVPSPAQYAPQWSPSAYPAPSYGNTKVPATPVARPYTTHSTFIHSSFPSGSAPVPHVNGNSVGGIQQSHLIQPSPVPALHHSPPPQAPVHLMPGIVGGAAPPASAPVFPPAVAQHVPQGSP